MIKSTDGRRRRIKRADAGTRVSLGMRVPGTLKNKIDAVAQLTGRSQAQEAERLIEMGLLFEREFSR